MNFHDLYAAEIKRLNTEIEGIYKLADTVLDDAAHLRAQYITACNRAARSEFRLSALLFTVIFIVALKVARDYLRKQ